MSPQAYLAALAPTLLLGSSVLLGVGCLLSATRLLRVRLQAAELAVAAALVFVGVALLPLPRPLAPVGLGAALRWGGSRDVVVDAGVTAPVAARGVGTRARPPAALATEPRPAAASPASAVLPDVDPPVVASASTAPSRERGARADPLDVVETDAPSDTPSASQAGVASVTSALASNGASVGDAMVAGYLLVAVGLAVWLAAGWVRLRGLLRAAQPAGPELAAWYERHAGTGRRPRLLVTARAPRPFCSGVLRPVIVLPADLALCTEAGGAPPAPTVAAVLHELAHARCGHPWRALVFAFALPVLYVHPLFWWLRRRARRAAEMVADAEAAAACGARTAYARGLLDLAEARTAAPRLVTGAVFVFRQPSELMERIQMLISRTSASRAAAHPARGLCTLTGLAAAAAVCVGLWGATPLPAQDRDEVSPELRRERDRLRDEVAALRREIEALRKVTAGEPGEERAGPTARDERMQLAIQEFLVRSQAAQRAETDRQPEVPAGERVGSTVRVRAGDSLERIARQHFGRPTPEILTRILALNPDLDVARLRVGATLRLPPRDVADPLVAEPSPAPSPAREPAAGNGDDIRVALDLVTRLVELQGEVAQAQLQARQEEQARAAGVSDATRAATSRIVLQTAERKLALVQQAIELESNALRGELAAAEERIATATTLREHGLVSASEVRERQTAVVRLRARLAVLEAGGAASSEQKPK